MNQDVYQRESQLPYFKSVVGLLNKYEDGWNIFIKAHEEKDFDIPLIRKKEFENDPYIPDTWLGLADRVISIIAHEKYNLSTNPNRIEIVRADQMLDAYVRPVPEGPAHWSFGKRRAKEQQDYDKNKHLAYEIIINSNPALAYCMDTNTPVMQMIVFAHASYGHNAFYKNNYLFKELTDADTIMAVNQQLRAVVEESESKYGIEEVERVLDFCHAMRFMDIHDAPDRKHRTQSYLETKKIKDRENDFFNPPRASVFNEKASEASADDQREELVSHPDKGERNILRFITNNVSHIPLWKKDIMRLSSIVSQNFSPNVRTKVINEGVACTMHYEIMETLFDIGLIDASMHGEFRRSHAGVVYQPPGSVIKKHPVTNEDVEIFVGSDINIYALGFEMFQDIKRICENPNQEDREWFPHIAGKENFNDLFLHIMESNSDETFIEQYLSPAVMRKFKYFLLEGELDDDALRVSAIHADEGFKKIRAQLAADFRISDKIPKISLKDYQEESDRCLVLRHDVIKGQKLDIESTKQILELVHAQTKHPVVLESINDSEEVVASFSFPINYNYKPQQRTGLHYGLM